jgi:hypothetical protein
MNNIQKLHKQINKLTLECERLYYLAKNLEIENERLKSLGNALATQVLIQMLSGNRSQALGQAYVNWRDDVNMPEEKIKEKYKKQTTKKLKK